MCAVKCIADVTRYLEYKNYYQALHYNFKNSMKKSKKAAYSNYKPKVLGYHNTNVNNSSGITTTEFNSQSEIKNSEGSTSKPSKIYL